MHRWHMDSVLKDVPKPYGLVGIPFLSIEDFVWTDIAALKSSKPFFGVGLSINGTLVFGYHKRYPQ